MFRHCLYYRKSERARAVTTAEVYKMSTRVDHRVKERREGEGDKGEMPPYLC